MGKYVSRSGSAFRLFRCLQYDCIAGFRFTLIPLFAVAVLCFALFAVAYGHSKLFRIDVSGMLASDVLGLVLAGAPRFEWRPGLLARLPLGWLALMGFTLYASLVYPTFDLRALGGRSLLAAGSRRIWLLSKMLWVCFVTAGAAGVMVATSLLVACILDMPFGYVVNDATLQLAMVSVDSIGRQAVCLAPFLIVAFTAITALAELQLVIALFVHPTVSFGACLACLVGGYFVQSPLLLGNGLMLARWGGIVNSGVSTSEVMVVAVVLCAVCCVVGMCVTGRVDIYEKGEQ